MGRKNLGGRCGKIWMYLDVCRSKGKLRHLLSVPAAARAAQTSPVPLHFSVHSQLMPEERDDFLSVNRKGNGLRSSFTQSLWSGRTRGCRGCGHCCTCSQPSFLQSSLPPGLGSSCLGLGCAGGAGKQGQLPGDTRDNITRVTGERKVRPKPQSNWPHWGWIQAVVESLGSEGKM